MAIPKTDAAIRAEAACHEELTVLLRAVQNEAIIRPSVVRGWMASPCPAVRGAVFALLNEHPQQVPSLAADERDAFRLNYLVERLGAGGSDRAYETDPGYVPGPYVAGHTLRAWFQQLWPRREEAAAEQTLDALRTALTRLAQAGDQTTVDAITTAVMEHLFADPDVAAYFGLWRHEGRLTSIHAEAVHLTTVRESKETNG